MAWLLFAQGLKTIKSTRSMKKRQPKTKTKARSRPSPIALDKSKGKGMGSSAAGGAGLGAGAGGMNSTLSASMMSSGYGGGGGSGASGGGGGGGGFSIQESLAEKKAQQAIEDKLQLRKDIHDITTRVERLVTGWDEQDERREQRAHAIELEEAKQGANVLIVNFEKLGMNRHDALDNLKGWFERLQIDGQRLEMEVCETATKSCHEVCAGGRSANPPPPLSVHRLSRKLRMMLFAPAQLLTVKRQPWMSFSTLKRV